MVTEGRDCQWRLWQRTLKARLRDSRLPTSPRKRWFAQQVTSLTVMHRVVVLSRGSLRGRESRLADCSWSLTGSMRLEVEATCR